MSLLLRRVWHEGDLCDMLIVGNRFAEIAPAGTLTAATDAEEPQETGGPTGPVEVIDAGARLAIVPPFYNGHTHAAMTLLRGSPKTRRWATGSTTTSGPRRPN